MKRKYKYNSPPEKMTCQIRCTPSTLALIRVAADAEGVTQASLVDALVRQYVVERGLEKPVGALVAHAEASEIQRKAWEAELRKQWQREQETRDELLPKH